MGDKIVVSGGQANHQLVPATEVFDGTRWTDVAPMPTPRDHLAVGVRRPVLLRGRRQGTCRPTRTRRGRALRPGDELWARMSSLPTPRGGLGAVVSGNRLVTIGGESSTGVYGTVEVLDLRTNFVDDAAGDADATARSCRARGEEHHLHRQRGEGRRPHRLRPHQRSHRPHLVRVGVGVAGVAVGADGASADGVDGVGWGVVVLRWADEWCCDDKVEGYDPAISTWQAGPNLPVKLHHDMAVLYHGEMVVMGGWIPRGSTLDAVASNRVFALPEGCVGRAAGDASRGAAGAAAVVGDKIVVSGGQANHQLVPATEVFDGVRWTDVAPIPTPRDHLAGATDGKYFYAVGGRDLSADKNIGAVERYDPATNVWARMSSLPTPRGGLGAVVSGNRLVTIGGESSTGVYGTVEVLDLRTNSWTTLPEMRTPRHGLAVLAVRNTIYTVNGAKDAGHTGSVPTNEAIDLTCGSGADCPS